MNRLKKYIFSALALALLSLSVLHPAAAQAQDLFVGSLDNDSVLRYDGTTGAPLGTFASGGGLDDPEGLRFGPDGNLYVASYETNEVRRYNGTTGAFIDVFVPAGSGGLSGPEGLAFGADGRLYVASSLTDSVLRYDGATGAFLGTFASGGGLARPFGLAFGPDGNLYAAGALSQNVVRYNGTTGASMGVFVSCPDQALGLTFGPDGNLYVGIGNFGTQVLRFNGTTGASMGVFASGGGLSRPRGLSFGPDGNLYVSSFGSNEVLRYDGSTGAFIDAFISAGSGGLQGPRFLVFRTPTVDSDGDGVPDSLDHCPHSDLRAKVDPGSGPTSVTNQPNVEGPGCSMQDLVNEAAAGARNHGDYVSAIVRLAKQWQAAGFITQRQRAELVSGAAQSDIGKK